MKTAFCCSQQHISSLGSIQKHYLNEYYNYSFNSNRKLTAIVDRSERRSIFKPSKMEQTIDRLVNTWQRCFDVTLPSKKSKAIRLHELETWDKPRAGNEIEHSAKIQALKNLLK